MQQDLLLQDLKIYERRHPFARSNNRHLFAPQLTSMFEANILDFKENSNSWVTKVVGQGHLFDDDALRVLRDLRTIIIVLSVILNCL